MIITYLKAIGYDYLPLPKADATWEFDSDGVVTLSGTDDSDILRQRLDAGLDMLGGVTGNFFIGDTVNLDSGSVIKG